MKKETDVFLHTHAYSRVCKQGKYKEKLTTTNE